GRRRFRKLWRELACVVRAAGRANFCRRVGADRKRKSAKALFVLPFRAPARVETRNAPLRRARPLRHRSRSRARANSLLPRQLQENAEEHTSELQSLAYLVCRLLLEKKNLYEGGRLKT